MSHKLKGALHAAPRGGPYTSDMAKRKIMGVQEARQKFAALIEGAAKNGETTILIRRSTPSAVLVPPEWFHRAAELMGEPWDDWTPPKPAPDA